MIATQYQSMPPISPFHKHPIQLDPPVSLQRTRNRHPTGPQQPTPLSLSNTRHSQASKMAASNGSDNKSSVRIQTNKLLPLTVDSHAIVEALSSEDDTTPSISIQGSNGSRTSSYGSRDSPQTDHVIQLSSIEQLMPRAYIRVCLAYRVTSDEQYPMAIEKLRARVREIVDAKPYLSGCVTDVKPPGQDVGRAEIRFSTQSYVKYPAVEVRTLLNSDGSQVEYDDLSEACLPPSRLRPEDVSALPPNVNPSDLAPVFRIQANLVKGGLIVSIYLHHCISDGTGLDLITTGNVLNDENTFRRPESLSILDTELGAFARQKTLIRRKLSTVPGKIDNTRNLKGRRLDGPNVPANAPGRGCVMMISHEKISCLLHELQHTTSPTNGLRHTKNSLLMALLWRHMTRARRPSVKHNVDVKTSSLLVPVDIRQKLDEALPSSYFGAAVDSAKVELDLDSLTEPDGKTLQEVSLKIREAVGRVNDSYVRQAIALANTADERTDVSDLQASCMDRATGADMYITSWLRLRTYESDLNMGLGGPEWVRKPWSRDPGSCIILPQRSQKPDYYEVVVQMTELDMERLLVDQEFMNFVDKVID